MDLAQLRQYIEALARSMEGEQQDLLSARLESLVSVFPFSEYEYMLMFLLDRGVLTFDQYEVVRNNYVASNKYLHLFGLAPRVFGETWGHKHIRDIDNRFLRPSKLLDSGYEGQYDLWLDGIRVEVKAARAINTRKHGDLASKALRYGSTEPFWMNYQQVKFDACDVFVFIGVWVDRIVYWVLSQAEARTHRNLSHQHRGGIEYQIGITNRNLADFVELEVSASELTDVVTHKGRHGR